MEQPTEAQIYTELETRIDLRGKKIETLSDQMKDLSNSFKAMKEQLNNFPKLFENMMQKYLKSQGKRYQQEDGEVEANLCHPAVTDTDFSSGGHPHRYAPFLNRSHSDEPLFSLPKVELHVSEEDEALLALIPKQTEEQSRVLTNLKEKIAKFSNQVNKTKFGNPRDSLSASLFKGEEHNHVQITMQGSGRGVYGPLKRMDQDGPTVEIIHKPIIISITDSMHKRDEEIKSLNYTWSVLDDTLVSDYSKPSAHQEGFLGSTPIKTSDSNIQVAKLFNLPKSSMSDDTGEPPTLIFPSEALSITTIYTPVKITFHRDLTVQPSWFFRSQFVSLIYQGPGVYNQKKQNTSDYNCVNTKVIKMELQLPLEKLRRMEMLLVTDYIEHVNGIGSVDVIEVMIVFPEEDNLHKFRKWLETQDPSILRSVRGKEGSSTRMKRSNSNSEEASTVDQDVLKLDLFCKLCFEKIGWGTKKVYELLHPVSNKYNKHENQLLLETFYTFNERFAKFHSKRITKSMTGTTGSKASKLIDDNEVNVSNDEKRKKVKHEEGMDDITAKEQHKSQKNIKGSGVISRWKGGGNTKLEGSNHAPVFMSSKGIPSIQLHNTPISSTRYCPQVRRWQQTLLWRVSRWQIIKEAKAHKQSGTSFNEENTEGVKRPFLDGREKYSKGSPNVYVGKKTLNFGLQMKKRSESQFSPKSFSQSTSKSDFIDACEIEFSKVSEFYRSALDDCATLWDEYRATKNIVGL